MSPRTIANILFEKNISIATLTDHNSTLNCTAFKIFCEEKNILPFFGMEVQTSEELHALTLFASLDAALDFSQFWFRTLPRILNKAEITGDQVFVNEHDEILDEVKNYLVCSSRLSLADCARLVHDRGGLIIPAHVDRPAFSMTSQLGDIVSGDWDALEFVNAQNVSAFPLAKNYPIVFSSDAHYVADIAKRFTILNLLLLCIVTATL